MVKPWRVILTAALIFVAGGITGAITARFGEPQKNQKAEPKLPMTQERRHDYLSKLDRELKLTSEQRQKIEAILAASQQRIKALWQQIEPQTKEEYQRTRKEISEHLDPEQREKMKKMHRGKGDKEKGDEKKNGEKKEEACLGRFGRKAC